MPVKIARLFDNCNFSPPKGLTHLKFTEFVVLIRPPAVNLFIIPSKCMSWSCSNIFYLYRYFYDCTSLNCTVDRILIFTVCIQVLFSPKIYWIWRYCVRMSWSCRNLYLLRIYIYSLLVKRYENWFRYDFVFYLLIIIHFWMYIYL